MTTDPDPDMMAAELALGLLDGEERAVALRRVLSDRGFAAEVEWWRRHLADLLDDYPSVPVPEGLIDRIAMASRPKPRSRLKTLIPAGLAVAAAVLLVLFLRPVPVPEAPSQASPPTIMIAALTPTGKDVAPFGATVDLRRGELRVAAIDLAPPGKSAQLWLIKDGTPHSLGLLARSGATRIALPKAERSGMRSGAVLAVSIEPPGGSPKPTPTGPVVASGALAAT